MDSSEPTSKNTQITAVDQNVGVLVQIISPSTARYFTIAESDLDRLGRGSPTSVFLNVGLFCLASFLSFLVTLLTVNFEAGLRYGFFVSICGVTGIAAVILMLLSWKYRESSLTIVKQIKENALPETE